MQSTVFEPLLLDRHNGWKGEGGLTLRKLLDVSLLNPHKPLFFDTENTSLDTLTCKPICLQFYQEDRPPVVVDVRGAPLDTIRPFLVALFSGKLLIVGHNLKYDWGVLRSVYGIKAVRLFDTMIAEQVLNGVGFTGARRAGVSLSLENVVKRVGITISKQERNYFADLDRRPEWDEPLPLEQVRYAATDVTCLPTLFYTQLQELKEHRLVEVMQREMQALPAFGEMERNGVLFDIPTLQKFIAEKATEAAALREKIADQIRTPVLEDRVDKFDKEMEAYNRYREAHDKHLAYLRDFCYREQSEPRMSWPEWRKQMMDEWKQHHPPVSRPRLDQSDVNVGSHVQLLTAFQKLHIPARDTTDDTLKELAETYPLCQLIRDYRGEEKFVESFGDSLIEKVHPKTGRIHPDIVQIGADTGRTSVTKPNLQQLPSRGTDGKRFRECIVAADGYMLVSNDYPNIELRIFTYLSGCREMRRAFAEGRNLHEMTARAMFELWPDVDVKGTIAVDRRGNQLNGASYYDNGKTVNFMSIYGGTKFRLAKILNTTVDEADRLLENYHNLYPEVREYHTRVKEQTFKRGYTRTLGGWRHPVTIPIRPPDRDRAGMREYLKQMSAIERIACNYPIQGTSAEVTKIALGMLTRRVDADLVHLILVVHDEILLEAPVEYAEETAACLEQVMTESCAVLMPDFPVDCSGAVISPYWSKG